MELLRLKWHWGWKWIQAIPYVSAFNRKWKGVYTDWWHLASGWSMKRWNRWCFYTNYDGIGLSSSCCVYIWTLYHNFIISVRIIFDVIIFIITFGMALHQSASYFSLFPLTKARSCKERDLKIGPHFRLLLFPLSYNEHQQNHTSWRFPQTFI